MASSLRANAPAFVSNSVSPSAQKAVAADKTVSKMKELPVESALFSNDFLNLIKASNREKNEKAPLLAILQAKNDPEGGLSDLAVQYDYLSLAKIYRIAMKIQSNGDIGTPLKEIAKEFKRPDALLLDGHGEPTLIAFGDENTQDPNYTIDHVIAEPYEYLESHAPVLLTGCETAQQLAEKIAAISKKAVTAPQKTAWTDMSYFHICKDHGLELVCFDENARQIDQRFFGGGKVSSCKNEEVYAAKIRFLYNEAKNGNSAAFPFLLDWNKLERKWTTEAVAQHYDKLLSQNKTEWRPFYIYLCHKIARKNVETNPGVALQWVFRTLDECNKALKSPLKKSVAEEIASTRENALLLSKTISKKTSDKPVDSLQNSK